MHHAHHTYCAYQHTYSCKILLTYVKHVVEAPGDNSIVIKCHVKRHKAAGHADASQEGRHLVPDADRSLPQPLPDSQLQVEHRDTQDEQHDEKRHQERA